MRLVRHECVYFTRFAPTNLKKMWGLRRTGTKPNTLRRKPKKERRSIDTKYTSKKKTTATNRGLKRNSPPPPSPPPPPTPLRVQYESPYGMACQDLSAS